jgi:hypothetical protein
LLQDIANRMITLFTPFFADSNNNAQNLTMSEGVARMDPTRFRVEVGLANCVKQDWGSFRNSYEWRA